MLQGQSSRILALLFAAGTALPQSFSAFAIEPTVVLPGQAVSLLVRENDPNYLLGDFEPVSSIRSVKATEAGGFIVNVKAGVSFGDNYGVNPPLAQLAKDHIYGNLDGLTGAPIQAEDAAATINIGGTLYARVQYSNLIHYNPVSTNFVYGASIDLIPDAPDKNNRIDGVIFVGDTPVFMPGDALPANGGFTGGTSSSIGFVDGSCDVAFFKADYSNASVTDGRGLFNTAGAALLYAGKSLGASGDTVQAKSFAIGNTAISDNGLHYIADADVGVGTSVDALIVDGVVPMTPSGTFVRDSNAIVTGGAEQFTSFNQLAINNNGKWAASAFTSADSSIDDVVLVNGVVAFREGDVLPKLGGGSAAALDGIAQYVDVNNNGDVAFYFGSSTSAGAIVLNGRVVLEIGDGIGSDTITKFGLSPIALSDRDDNGVVNLLFHAADTGAFSSNDFGLYHMSFTVYLPGDTNGDGDIDDSDLGNSLANYTGPIGAAGNKTFAQGDTDGDGDVDDSDLGTSFAGYTGPLSPTVVPEPASIALITLGMIACFRRQRN